MSRIIEVELNDGSIFKYEKECKHEELHFLEELTDYDFEGYELSYNLYVCLECGKKVRK